MSKPTVMFEWRPWPGDVVTRLVLNLGPTMVTVDYGDGARGKRSEHLGRFLPSFKSAHAALVAHLTREVDTLERQYIESQKRLKVARALRGPK